MSCHSNTIQEEFDVLGSQTLADLQATIYCVQSHLSEDPSQKENSFFFIEGKFYAEAFSRDAYPEALVSALRWLDENADKRMLLPPKRRKCTGLVGSDVTVGEFFRITPLPGVRRVLLQEEAVLKDIAMTVGACYLYCHLAGCEHFLYLTGIRTYNKVKDLRRTSDYPRLCQQAKMKRRRCGVCELWSAEFVVYYDRLAATNPMFYCRHCYHMLHYRADNTILYDDFLVYPYLRDMK